MMGLAVVAVSVGTVEAGEETIVGEARTVAGAVDEEAALEVEVVAIGTTQPTVAGTTEMEVTLEHATTVGKRTVPQPEIIVGTTGMVTEGAGVAVATTAGIEIEMMEIDMGEAGMNHLIGPNLLPRMRG
jgi:hypothetical protein